MKKLTIILLMLVYGLSSSGMSITIHYCMSNAVGWNLVETSSSSLCGTCGMKKQGHKGCCHDERKVVKNDKDQKNFEAFVYTPKAPVTSINTDYPFYSANFRSQATEELSLSHSPPYRHSVPQYIFNCVFRV